MGILSGLRPKDASNKTITIALIGPTLAGKTTLVRYLESGEPVVNEPHITLGIEIRQKYVEIDGYKIRAIDTAGHVEFQQLFWEIAVEQADAIIFVIDATIRETSHPDKYEVRKKQFDYAMDIIPEQVPLLVLLNKQDLVEMKPMDATEAIKIFDKKSLLKRTITYLPCSAKYGDGIYDAIKWLVSQVEE